LHLKTNFSPVLRQGLLDQLPDRLEQILERLIVSGDPAFQLGELSGKFLVRSQLLAHGNKNLNDADTGFYGSLTAQYVRQLERTMFGEHPREFPPSTTTFL